MTPPPEEVALPGDWRAGEAFHDKFIRKFKNNPYIYLGIAATIGAFTQATIAMRRGQAQKMNYWLRMRVLMQGLTIAAFLGGVYRLQGVEGIWGQKAPKAEEKAAVEKAEFRERLKAAEEAHKSRAGSVEQREGVTPSREQQEKKSQSGFLSWIRSWSSSGSDANQNSKA